MKKNTIIGKLCNLLTLISCCMMKERKKKVGRMDDM